MKKTPATLLADFYKLSHREQYPEKTESVYSTLTPRSNIFFPRADKIIVFGVQGFVKKYLIEYFNNHFFRRPKQEIVNEYMRIVKNALGKENPDTNHIEELHDLGYLPIKIRALKEGSRVPMRVPVLTIENTDKRFFWLTNYLETILSTETWQPMTSATIAYQYKKILDKYALKTVGDTEAVGFQGHDFSMRGMSSLESAQTSGAGHLLSFNGTDTIPAITYLEEYYDADVEKELVGSSISATEHSVMCSYGDENEFDLFKHLMTSVYPSGFFSVVSDTWDFWKVIGEYLPKLKKEVMNREGKVVIRPDSGDPVLILIGDPNGETELERKGLIECLWDIFGGTMTRKGYKLLDSHIGAIYGDSITLDRCERIVEGLEAKGFASVNVVFGIGSYTYQYNTRDTFGFAVKATHAIVDGEERMLFKNPKTDDGTKRSQRGRVAVINENDELTLIDGLTIQAYNSEFKNQDQMEDVFIDGKLVRDQSLQDIRKRIND
ncbi:nicotinate phosphoribosyltransferase [Bacillus sp. IS1]|uniref:nicotinate phosphoribosyltransferase n=1 Tax=Bacillus TaxID=1386 RepID=UPI0028F878DB|nr:MULTISPECIES: nicotinate phosphoribosyltransferase [Bacillus]MDU0074872.1 nicotinate phosphoribosyltransferase [Bacillus sp. IG2]MDU0100582.1 nicotinate phosphoribosyltransferase [Bacillus sp. IS1]MEC2272756.1 nicotinate phosphoribosyltransferase [Bacillus velezensis]MED3680931.1 nicotinate phosphoribosyltransferase [Bacillus velezensis]